MIQPKWVKASDPNGLKNPKNKLYSKEFIGPYKCDNAVAKCISNIDLEEELRIKAILILTIGEMLEEIDRHNRQ